MSGFAGACDDHEREIMRHVQSTARMRPIPIKARGTIVGNEWMCALAVVADTQMLGVKPNQWCWLGGCAIHRLEVRCVAVAFGFY